MKTITITDETYEWLQKMWVEFDDWDTEYVTDFYDFRPYVIWFAIWLFVWFLMFARVLYLYWINETRTLTTSCSNVYSGGALRTLSKS